MVSLSDLKQFERWSTMYTKLRTTTQVTPSTKDRSSKKQLCLKKSASLDINYDKNSKDTDWLNPDRHNETEMTTIEVVKEQTLQPARVPRDYSEEYIETTKREVKQVKTARKNNAIINLMIPERSPIMRKPQRLSLMSTTVTTCVQSTNVQCNVKANRKSCYPFRRSRQRT